MKLAAKRGFTIVELLVVITIIGILMAMLFPAINAARVNARRIQCVSRQAQLGKGMLAYVTKGDRFPGYLNVRDYALKDSSQDKTLQWNWVVKILPDIDRGDVYDYKMKAAMGGGDATQIEYVTRIDSLICPADPPANRQEAALSYVVNAGKPDVAWNTIPGGDLKQNGVFFNHRWETPGGESDWVKMSLSYITQHDGVANTLMLTENVNALHWGPSQRDDTGEQKYAVVWGDTGLAPLNGPAESFRSGPAAQYTRPSSRYPGGFVATFCDGHTRFINEGIGYRVYNKIMTRNGLEVEDQQFGEGTQKYQPPLAESELDK